MGPHGHQCCGSQRSITCNFPTTASQQYWVPSGGRPTNGPCKPHDSECCGAHRWTCIVFILAALSSQQLWLVASCGPFYKAKEDSNALIDGSPIVTAGGFSSAGLKRSRTEPVVMCCTDDCWAL